VRKNINNCRPRKKRIGSRFLPAAAPRIEAFAVYKFSRFYLNCLIDVNSVRALFLSFLAFAEGMPVDFFFLLLINPYPHASAPEMSGAGLKVPLGDQVCDQSRY
jgi:hypothetical protein